jgi:hypothetical protein
LHSGASSGRPDRLGAESTRSSPLVRLTHLEVLYANRSAARWVRRSIPSIACFQARTSTRLDLPSARLLLRLRAHPSVTLLLFRVPSLALLAPVLSDIDHRAQWSLSFTCLGFRPSWRHHTHAATFRETSQVPLRCVLRLSQPLDALLRARVCELVSSRYRVQGSLCSGASLPAQPPFLVGRSLPPCRCFIVALRACFHFRRNQRAPTCDAPRLRGFYLRKAAFYESGYSPRPHPLPSSVSSPPGLPFSRRQYRLTQHLPLMMFPRLGLHAVCSPFGDQP